MTAVREGWPQPRGRTRVEVVRVRAADVQLGDVVMSHTYGWQAVAILDQVTKPGMDEGKIRINNAYFRPLDLVDMQWCVPLYPSGMVDVDLPDYEPECCGSGSCEVCRPDLHEGRRGD